MSNQLCKLVPDHCQEIRAIVEKWVSDVIDDERFSLEIMKFGVDPDSFEKAITEALSRVKSKLELDPLEEIIHQALDGLE